MMNFDCSNVNIKKCNTCFYVINMNHESRVCFLKHNCDQNIEIYSSSTIDTLKPFCLKRIKESEKFVYQNNLRGGTNVFLCNSYHC